MNVKKTLRLSTLALIYLFSLVCLASLLRDANRKLYQNTDIQGAITINDLTHLNFITQAWMEDEHAQQKEHFTAHPHLTR